MTHQQWFQKRTLSGTAALALALGGMSLGGCSGMVTSDDASRRLFSNGESCTILDFETQSGGAPVTPGDVLTDIYAGDGIDVRVWRNNAMTDPGLPVAFDGANPTGGDDDLLFPEQHNLLISQEKFHDEDIVNGFVSEPDDDGRGAIFEITFDTPVCLDAVTLLDIDEGEVPTDIYLLNEIDGELLHVSVTPAGNNEKQRIDLQTTCGVFKLWVCIPSSGAVDDIEICTDDTEPPPDCENDPTLPGCDTEPPPDCEADPTLPGCDTEPPPDDDTETPPDGDTETPPEG